MGRGYPGGPHAAVRTAVVWAVLREELDRAAAFRPKLNIVDVGGGTGGFAVPLAQAGHEVIVIDSSADALAALVRRAAEGGVADRVHAVQADADALPDLIQPDHADLVLCHSVLEIVDSPADVAAAVAAVLRPGAGHDSVPVPGGAASIIVANRAAAVLARAMGGHLAQAAALLGGFDGDQAERGSPPRHFDVESAAALLAKSGLVVEQIHGVRVVADLVPATVLERDHRALLDFELDSSARPPYRDIASQLHLLARRP